MTSTDQFLQPKVLDLDNRDDVIGLIWRAHHNVSIESLLHNLDYLRFDLGLAMCSPAFAQSHSPIFPGTGGWISHKRLERTLPGSSLKVSDPRNL